MHKKSRFGVKKVYIVFSDGRPEDDVIPQDQQVSEIKKLVKRRRSEGDTFIHVALGPDVSMPQIYPYSLEFPEEGYPKLVHQFGKLLKKWVVPIH